MRQPTISNAAKTFIVQSLACFDSPSDVAASVRATHGVSIARQSIEAYDPTKAAGERLCPKWRAVFFATRAAFIAEVGRIGITHRAVRLRMLQRMADKAEAQGNLKLVLSLLEQAAKEMGGAYTNRHEIVGSGGKDLPAPAAPVVIYQQGARP